MTRMPTIMSTKGESPATTGLPETLDETDLPVKGQIFHREAENRLFRRPREAKKLNFK
jgi:hypothetical protein